MFGGNIESSRHLMITAKKAKYTFYAWQTCVIAKDEKKPTDLTIVSDSKPFIKAIKARAKEANNPVFIKFTNLSKTNDHHDHVKEQISELLQFYKRVAYT